MQLLQCWLILFRCEKYNNSLHDIIWSNVQKKINYVGTYCNNSPKRKLSPLISPLQNDSYNVINFMHNVFLFMLSYLFWKLNVWQIVLLPTFVGSHTEMYYYYYCNIKQPKFIQNLPQVFRKTFIGYTNVQ